MVITNQAGDTLYTRSYNCDKLLSPFDRSDRSWLCSLVCGQSTGGTYNREGPVARHHRPPERLVAWWRSSRTVLTGSSTFVLGARDIVIPRSSFLYVLALDVKPLGTNTSLFSYFALFPCYCPLLVGPKSHLSSPSEEVSKVLSV